MAIMLPPWLRRRLNPDNFTARHLAAGVRRHGWRIGAFSYGAPRVRFAAPGSTLIIGSYCSIADGVEILLGGNHRLDFGSTYPFAHFPQLWPEAKGLSELGASKGPVTIGSDVWIGTGAMILSGISIGDGAVIGARAVVTKDVPAYAIVAGNPARLVGRRVDEDVAAELVRLAWWDLPRAEIVRLMPLLSSDRIEDLIAALRRLRATV